MFCFENVSNAENMRTPCLDPCGMAIPQVRATGLAVPATVVARPGTDPARRASAVAVRGLLYSLQVVSEHRIDLCMCMFSEKHIGMLFYVCIYVHCGCDVFVEVLC